VRILALSLTYRCYILSNCDHTNENEINLDDINKNEIKLDDTNKKEINLNNTNERLIRTTLMRD